MVRGDQKQSGERNGCKDAAEHVLHDPGYTRDSRAGRGDGVVRHERKQNRETQPQNHGRVGQLQYVPAPVNALQFKDLP
jgi:hypothetical protein